MAKSTIPPDKQMVLRSAMKKPGLLKWGLRGASRAFWPLLVGLTAWDIISLMKGDPEQSTEDHLARALLGDEYAGVAGQGLGIEGMMRQQGDVNRLADMSMMQDRIAATAERQMTSELADLMVDQQRVMELASVPAPKSLGSIMLERGLL